MGDSEHLHRIISKHQRTANVQVVFLDIEKYSVRRTQSQIDVIDAFTACLDRALTETARKYISYTQGNDVNFSTDVIRLPTGDGAAIAFTFDGLHDIHLSFSEVMLQEAGAPRREAPCEKFNGAGWCNCHAYFNLRVEVAEGKAILYKDVNGSYNIAGNTINMAARIMAMMGRNQIGFTKESYDQIIDMVDDPAMSDRFREYENVRLKHGLRVSIYQYLAPDNAFVNSGSVEELNLEAQLDSAMTRLSSSGIMPLPDLNQDRVEMGRATLNIVEQLEQAMAIMKGLAKKEASIDAPDRDPDDPAGRFNKR